jgi:hypothetical protein
MFIYLCPILACLVFFAPNIVPLAAQLLFMAVYAMAIVPMCLARIYQQVALSQTMDVYYLNAWVALFQVIFTLLCIPLQSLSVLGEEAVGVQGKGIQSYGWDEKWECEGVQDGGGRVGGSLVERSQREDTHITVHPMLLSWPISIS